MQSSAHDGVFAALIGLLAGFGATWIREYCTDAREKKDRSARSNGFASQTLALVSEIGRLAKKMEAGEASLEIWNTYAKRSIELAFSAEAAINLSSDRLAYLMRIAAEVQKATECLCRAPAEHLPSDRIRALRPSGLSLDELSAEILRNWDL